MKRLFVMLAAAAALVGCSTQPKGTVKCEIYGAIDNLEEVGYVRIVDQWAVNSVIDSVKIEKGNTFHFKNVECLPTFARLFIDGDRPICYIFIEEGKVRVAGNYETGEVAVTGTPSNEAFEAWMARNMELTDQYKEAVKNNDEARAMAIDAEYEAMNMEGFKNNLSNVFGVFMLRQVSYSTISADVLKYINELSEDIKALPIVERVKAKAECRFKTEPQVEGSDYVPHYIDIVMPNLEGEMVSLKSVVENEKNRYVLLDFWASWCGPCMGEVPTLLEAYALYHDKGFEIYGVSFDMKKEAWSATMAKHKMGWVNVSELNRFKCQASDDYAVESIPTNFLIDCSNGVIIAKNLHGKEVIEKLAELLK